MSVLNIAVYPTSMAFMADTKVTGNSGLKTVQKVYKNGSILFGFVGELKHAVEFTMPIMQPGFIFKDEYQDKPFIQVALTMDALFYQAMEEERCYNTTVAIGGQIGDKLVAKIYCLGNKNDRRMQLTTMISNEQRQYHYIGHESHRKFFDELIARDKPVTIEEFMALFREAVDYGVQFDEHINNLIDFETVFLAAKSREPLKDYPYEGVHLPEEFDAPGEGIQYDNITTVTF